MRTIIHWRFTAEDGQGSTAPAAADDWLSADERRRFSALRVEKRRREWLLGRLNAKALLVDMVESATGERLEAAAIDVARHASGAPFVRLALEARPVGGYQPGSRLPLVVSNSHSNHHALFVAAWAETTPASAFTLGVDLEWVEPRSAGFIHDFLTPAERRYCDAAADRDLRANLVWSAKESVLKALHRGLTADTYWLTCLPPRGAAEAGSPLPDPGPMLATVDLRPRDPAWLPLAIGALDPRLGAEERSFAGLWRTIGGFVATLVIGRAS